MAPENAYFLQMCDFIPEVDEERLREIKRRANRIVNMNTNDCDVNV